MSKVAELYTDIGDMLEKGTHPATISAVLDVPIVFVYDVIETIESANESQDFDPFLTVNS